MQSPDKSKRSKIDVGKKPIDKIMDKLDRDESTGCWNYTGYSTAYGYGMIVLRANGKRRMAPVHRMMWEHFNGPIPSGMYILHGCDNPRCCNPDHLRCGTPQENSNDAIKRNRMKRGVDNNLSIFSENEVHSIRRLYDRNVPIAEIAREFGASRSAVREIGRRNHWKHLPELDERPTYDFRQVTLIREIVDVADRITGVTNLQPQQVVVACAPEPSPEVRNERPSEIVAALYRFA